jgi:hypothetical protein
MLSCPLIDGFRADDPEGRYRGGEQVAVTTTTVGSARELEVAVAEYSTRGYFLVNKTDTMAMLRKPKEFNVLIAILGFLFCVVGLVIYAIVYSMQSDQVVEIRVVERQTPKYMLSDDRRWWWDGSQWQDTQLRVPPGAERSEDTTQWWDGTSWRPVPTGERMWSSPSVGERKSPERGEQ